MTTRRAAALAVLVAASVGASVTAKAQQRPQPLPTSHSASSNHPVPIISYPATVAQYEDWTKWKLESVRRMATQHSDILSAASANKLILRVKDCASRAEADGVVTRAEDAQCDKVFTDAVQELAIQYQLSHPAH